MTEWVEDAELGAGFWQTTFELGADPDDEGEVVATLVKADPPRTVRGAVLYLHGFTDYFFQTGLSAFFTDRGYAFHALDLRKCGRSRRPGQTAHYVSDVELYDAELDQALAVIRRETDSPVLVVGHSTGGLVAPLWMARRIAEAGGAAEAGFSGLVLNSPWFDLQGAAWRRSFGTHAIRALATVRPMEVLRVAAEGVYGMSLSAEHHGEWTYDADLKPIDSFPVTVGWLAAIRKAHLQLQRGLDVRVPSLVMRSSRSWFSTTYGPKAQTSDTVLDVKQIARWAGCLGGHTWVVPIEDGMHDLFLSRPDVREHAYDVVDRWMRDRGLL